MRVISGSRKGYRLKGPKGKNTRPTEDRIKESLFNILRDIDEESIALDLFAGSGSIGIEFLSRGAKKVYFIDKSFFSIKAIKENLDHTNLTERAQVIKNEAIKIIDLFSKDNIKFDYIFIDPPYGQGLIMKALKGISDKKVLKENGIIIVEHEKELILEENIYDLVKINHRSYGNKSLTFFTIS